MKNEDIIKLNAQKGDRIFIEYENDIIRSGIYLGTHSLTWDKDEMGVCITYDNENNIIDWVALNFIRNIELTIPLEIIQKINNNKET